jgi:hypothetical protein
MSISAIPRVTPTTPPQMRRGGDMGAERPAAAPRIDSVAVVDAGPARYAPVSSRIARPDAAFLIHLIATAEQAPQTRVLRRADVADAMAAYGAAMGRTAPHDLKRTA